MNVKLNAKQFVIETEWRYPTVSLFVFYFLDVETRVIFFLKQFQMIFSFTKSRLCGTLEEKQNVKL